MEFRTLHEFPAAEFLLAWREFLTRVDFPSHYIAPEYFLEPYWEGSKRFAILALEGSRVTGVLTGLRSNGEVICGFEARPQIAVDPAHDPKEVCGALICGLLDEADSAELITVYTWGELNLQSFAERGFRARRLPGNVVLDLTRGSDVLFSEFSKDRRRNIRFAEKHGVQVAEVVTQDDVVQAFKVYETWWHNHEVRPSGAPPSFDVFERAAKLNNNRLILIARLDEKPIAINTFRFFSGGLFESASNSSLREFVHLKPNDLLQWKGIQWACARGLRRHSLGGCHPFLCRFGGEVVPVIRYRIDKTLLRQHDLRETTRDLGRRILHLIPDQFEQGVRQVLRRRTEKSSAAKHSKVRLETS